MSTAFEKLNKILSLEEKMGYLNKAVIGGLEKFAPYWREEALSESSSTEEQEAIGRIVKGLAAYPTCDSLEQRRTIVSNLLDLLRGQPESRTAGADRPAPPPSRPGGESAPVQARDDKSARTAPGITHPAHRNPEPDSEPLSTSSNVPSPEKPASVAVAEEEAKPTPPSPRAPGLSKPSPAPARRERQQPARQRKEYGLDSSVLSLPSVGNTQAKRLQKMGINTVRDLIYHFPRRYDDYSNLKPIRLLEPGEDVTIIANIRRTKLRRLGSNRSIITCTVSDGTGSIDLTWFNQPYLERRLQAGRQIVVSGRVDQYLGRPTMNSPEWEPLEKELIHTARLVPVYGLTEGVSGRWLRRLIKKVVGYWADYVPEFVPESTRARHELLDIAEALREIHFPSSSEMLERARRRLVFDELFLLQLGVLRQRAAWRSEEGRAIALDQATLDRFLGSLPFSLTAAQQRVLKDILGDISRAVPMNRLLEGDVGSGKTIVAAAAALAAVTDGYQVAIMAPTELLADQHYQSFQAFLASAIIKGPQGERPVVIKQLTGSLTPSEKAATCESICQGEVDIVVGTHALIQEGVEFNRLALAIIDEQHRFGVAQRAALRQKGYNPHLLVMTATPIPRTLSLTLFGDLDISIIDELPPGRQEIKTYIVTGRERERAYHFIARQVEEGHQAFIICPLVEESDKIDAKAAVEEHRRLQEQVFSNLRVGLLHGRMKAEEKDDVMRRFQSGELHILVSTAVVEVGIDIPNATVMLIEGANRFGLAQLHQFRGRVGRGDAESYCLLLCDDTNQEGIARLRAVAESRNGFALAERDLEMRGPGDFFGTRQSGLPTLRLARMADVPLLEMARSEAAEILQQDSTLSKPAHRELVAQVDGLWMRQTDPS